MIVEVNVSTARIAKAGREAGLSIKTKLRSLVQDLQRGLEQIVGNAAAHAWGPRLWPQ
ncbi:MAG: hypothetical protein Q7T30_02315 [Planctomycetota bacterium]|nr:hypothetical protein [Planctomycetota bacterium]